MHFVFLLESISWPPPDMMGDVGDGKFDRKRKRKSRWGGDEKEKAFIPGMPTVIPPGLSKEQERLYLCKYLSINANMNVKYRWEKNILVVYMP